MAVPHWCFCGVQWLFIHVIYIKCLGFWLERKGQLKKEVPSVAVMTNFGFGPNMVWIGYSSPCGWSSPCLIISHGMVCLGPQWSANIFKVCWGCMELKKSGGIVHLKSPVCVCVCVVLFCFVYFCFSFENWYIYGSTFKFPAAHPYQSQIWVTPGRSL